MTARTLTELLDTRAREAASSDRLAYAFLLGGQVQGETLTYAQLRDAAIRLATRLMERVPPGARAMLVYPPSLEFIVAFFGCLYARVVPVPIYPPAPPRVRTGALHFDRVVADTGAEVVLSSREYLNLCEALPQLERLTTGTAWMVTDELPATDPGAWTDPGVDPDTIALLQYTSGSTALPRGVVLTHGNLMANHAAIQEAAGLDSHEVAVSWLPMYHDMGLIGFILEPMYLGVPAYLMSPLDFLQRPARWLEAISQFGATCSGGPNFAYELCIKRVAERDLRRLDLATWRVAFCGAEPLHASTLRRFAEKFGPAGLRRQSLYPCYGLAESTLLVTGSTPGSGPTTRWVLRERLARESVAAEPGSPGAVEIVSSGRAPSGNDVAIVDPTNGGRAPDGSVGEIWVRGPSVGSRYWEQEEASGRVFGGTLDGQGGGFLRTGDLGFMVDGELFVTGRIKDMVVIRGRNVYPQDVEVAAQASHPRLRSGCGAAFGVHDGGDERLVLVQETASTDPGELNELITAIRQAVFSSQQIRLEAVTLVAPSTLPKTSSGKLRRADCRAAFLNGELRPLAEWRDRG